MNYKVLVKISLLSYLILAATFQAYSQQITESSQIDVTIQTNDSTKTMKSQKVSYWKRLLHGNVDRTHERRFDVSFAAAPSYTREASFGIGGMASGLYRVDRKDSIMPPSDITLVFNASIQGFYALEARGNNYFKNNRSLLSYEVGFTTKPLDFWGISYDATSINPVIDYTRQQVKIDANYQYKLLSNFSVGGTLDFSYTKATKIDNISYLESQKKSYVATGLGISVQYDSRDFIPNPKQGIYLMLRQSIFPEQLNDCERTLYRTTLVADLYQKIWQGGVLAMDLFSQINSNNAPWPLREELGGNQRMRGYYAGRYIDNNIASAQIELRQHLIQRFGCTVWMGGGTVFPTLEEFRVKNILPNYGIGLRWEFKHNVNARIDYGFGKQTGGFVFNIAEAF